MIYKPIYVTRMAMAIIAGYGRDVLRVEWQTGRNPVIVLCDRYPVIVSPNRKNELIISDDPR